MANKSSSLMDFKNPSIVTLNLTWIAIFLSFVVWFIMVGFLSKMIEQFNWLSKSNVKALLVKNVVLTISARIIVGSLIDKYGSRKIMTTIWFTPKYIGRAEINSKNNNYVKSQS